MDSGTVGRIISLISEPPPDRCEKEILEFLPYLKAKIFALSEMSTDTWVEVLKHAKYRKLRKNRFLKNTIGYTDRLYIVLTGGLSVFIAMQQSVLPPIVDSKNNMIRSIRQFGIEVDSLGLVKVVEERYLNLAINVLGPGKVVEESYRLENVHMITDADTDLMVISKNLYERTMQV
ncbi:unnamed protein product [Mytilus coruscus]|uniref:Uncharacterized protein n=1 Tax=Mytilus coruscus TaxID=42192 RepID=A0A6J8CQM0_MYTCO|nr:unnamed protein product [Mytilus coruscus]